MQVPGSSSGIELSIKEASCFSEPLPVSGRESPSGVPSPEVPVAGRAILAIDFLAATRFVFRRLFRGLGRD